MKKDNKVKEERVLGHIEEKKEVEYILVRAPTELQLALLYSNAFRIQIKLHGV